MNQAVPFVVGQEIVDDQGVHYWFKGLAGFGFNAALCQRQLDRLFVHMLLQVLSPAPGPEYPSCEHEYVNVGFFQLTYACKHCGADK